MPRYSVNIAGNVIKFRAESESKAKSHAFRISAQYSDLKRLPSRWWHLIWLVVIGLGYYAGLQL